MSANGRLRVGLDYLPAVTHWPGVGRYARELVRALVQLPDGPELRLLEWGPERLAIGEPWTGLAQAAAPERIARLRVRLPRRTTSWAARLGLGLPRLLGEPALFHRIHAHWPPLAGLPQVQPVPELPREGTRAADEQRARFAHIAAFVVASTAGERELVQRFGVAPARIARIATGCEHWARELGEPVEPREPAQLLVLGALRRERAHAAIVAAFERLHARREAGRLVIAGPDGPAGPALREQLARSPAREAITWLRALPEGEMPKLVAECACLVHISEGELTPVTPLEACAVGTAVLASRLPAFEEALGAHALWLESGAERDPALLIDALRAAIASGFDREARAQRRALAQRFTWAAHAEGTLALWQRVAAKLSPSSR